MTRIKICGITNMADAVAAAGMGVDMLGFVFYKASKRYIEPRAARDIIRELPPSVEKVGVFVNETEEAAMRIAREAACTILQFHGDESDAYCNRLKGMFKIIKAFRVRGAEDLEKAGDYDVDLYLFDTYIEGSFGGTGESFDWKVLKKFKPSKPIILSGGLTPENVKTAIAEIKPYGVDVSSGIEKSPGRKDARLMATFVKNVRSFN